MTDDTALMRPLSAALAISTALAIAAWALWVEPRRVVVRRRTLRLPLWPARLDRLRIAIISDLHAGAPHIDADKLRRVVMKTNDERPDLVALLGDYVDPDVAFGTFVSPEDVAAQLAELRAPRGVFAVLGNHDWSNDGLRIIRGLERAGITVLENDAVRISPAADELWLAGIADASTREPEIAGTLSEAPVGAVIVVLTHDPDIFPLVPDRVALTLAGHTHGGQVAIPVLRRRVIPSAFGERFAGGHVRERGRHLFISVGLGTSRFPIRLGAPPELALLELRPA